MKSLFLALACLAMSVAIPGCEKDPEVIIETEYITIIDTVTVVDTVTITETIFQSVPDTATTFILVRHAETTGGGSNPGLSAAGQERSAELTRILANVELDAVYSTNFQRTMQTAQPVAAAHGLSVVTYDPFMPEAVTEQVLGSFPKGIVLIVGHSNTTPDFLNVMQGGNAFADLPESEYDNLFIAHVSQPGNATVIHLKYGQ